MSELNRQAEIRARRAAVGRTSWRWQKALEGLEWSDLVDSSGRILLDNTREGFVNTFISLLVNSPEAQLIAHAPDDIDWLDEALTDQQQRIEVLKKSIDLALATDPDAALKHIVGVVEALFGENAGPLVNDHPTTLIPVYSQEKAQEE